MTLRSQTTDHVGNNCLTQWKLDPLCRYLVLLPFPSSPVVTASPRMASSGPRWPIAYNGNNARCLSLNCLMADILITNGRVNITFKSSKG